MKVEPSDSRRQSRSQNLGQLVRSLASCLAFLASLFSLSCNQTFQPEVNYKPKLNVYSVLFANARAAYVRVMSVVESPTDVSEPVHGAAVTIRSSNGTLSLVDTTAIIDAIRALFYYGPLRVITGQSFTVSVSKEGYPTSTASAVVPFGYATILEQSTYEDLRDPGDATSDISVVPNLSHLASAAFIRLLVEYRGIDSMGKFRVSSFNLISIDSVNPFTEIEPAQLPIMVSIKYGLKFTTLMTDTAFEHLYRVRTVPQTILINGDGRVKNNWPGELSAGPVKEVISITG